MADPNRRVFITLLGGAAVAPLTAQAQQSASPRHIGVLLVGLSPESKAAKQFRLGLRDAGFSEGRDVVIEWRSANGDYDRVPALVADLLERKVDVIVQDSIVGTEVTKRATSKTAIVMALVLDPVGSDLINSLAHPGGNVTGLSMMATELYPKRRPGKGPPLTVAVPCATDSPIEATPLIEIAGRLSEIGPAEIASWPSITGQPGLLARPAASSSPVHGFSWLPWA